MKAQAVETESEIVTFKVTPAMKKQLQALAAKENRSVSNYIKNLIQLASAKK
jgi:hypothetical protein